jgi:hypothetical protein
MGYDPYGQQPQQQQQYDPSAGYQPPQPQPYDPTPQVGVHSQYQAPGTYAHVPHGPPPPPAKKKMSTLMIIVVIIVVIIIVGVSICAGLMALVWMAPFESGPGDSHAVATLVSMTFSNPDEGTTTNGGGWATRVTAIAGGKPALSTLTITIKTPAGVEVASLSGVSTSKADLSHSGNPAWYLKKRSGTMKYAESSEAKNLDYATKGDVAGDEFQTIQGAHFLFLDNDADGTLSIHDMVMTYKDSNGDGENDITSGYSVSITVPKGTVGTATLN